MARPLEPLHLHVDDLRYAEVHPSGKLHPDRNPIVGRGRVALDVETELIEQFGVSRPTVRNAIAALEAEGLITVLHGKGAFVRRTSDRPTHTHRRDIARDGDHYDDTDTDGPAWRDVEEPATYRTNATPTLALALGVPEHSPLFVYDRLLADGADRRIFHRLYLPFTTCLEIDALQDNPFRPSESCTAS